MGRIKEYWPSYYYKILDFLELDQTEEAELRSLENEIEKLLENQFVLTSDELATFRRERMLNIRPDPRTETLENRKLRILNRYQTKPPFSIQYLQQQLDFLLGRGRAVATTNIDDFVLTVTTSIDDAFLFKEMEHTIQTVKPANMVFQQETSVRDRMVIKERAFKQNLTRKTKLSTTWKLGSTPFAIRGEEVKIF